MDGLTLIGKIAGGLVERTLNAGKGEPGLVRFVLHALSNEEIVAIVEAIQDEPGLAARLEIALPRYAFDQFPSIAPANLTDISTTDLRHAECDREGRLIALIDDSQGQSLAQVDKLDASALLNEASAESWIDTCTSDLNLPPDLTAQWVAALRALIRLDRVSMRQIANYIIRTAQFVREGERIMIALGRALPELRLPRFDALFDEIPPAQRTQPSQWQKRFLAHWRRDCFIAKRDATQIPFSTSKLRERLESQQATFTEDVYAVLQGYVNASPSEGEAAFAPFLQDWPEIRSFFEDAQRNDAKSIAKETQAFYALQEDGLLGDDDVSYLDELDARGRNPSKNERDEDFFARHALELRQEPRVSALWDRFVFGPEVPCTDLIEGLLQCVRRLRQNTGSAKRLLVVEGNERAKGHFLGLNDDVCRMFATRYCGLEAALDGLVAFRHTMAFRYPTFAEEIENYARRTPNATGRKARQLRFRVWIEEDGKGGVPVRLVWEANLDSIGIGLNGDLQRLLDNKTKGALVRCTAGHRRARTRGGNAGIALHDLSSLEPASQRNRGSFVPASSRCESLALEWRRELKSLRTDDLVAAPVAEQLSLLFGSFETAYQLAISDFSELGPRAPSLANQAQAFGTLLDALVDKVRSPVALDRLAKPLMEIGIARVEGPISGRPTVILCPWQPLRLEAQHGRILKLQEALTFLLSPDPVQFTDGSGSLFFSELGRGMRDAGRPELVMTWPNAKPTLVAQVDARHDYSLHEPPVIGPSIDGATNENALPVARQVAELVQNYLKLQPHEKDNLSVVLFNCDAAALPQAVVDNIRLDAERDGNDAMCQVVLRHTDEEQLRDLYQQIVMRELENDNLHANEATRDFMSRLRISIMVNQQAPTSPADGPPYDIVFCHDVISRQAELGWVDITRISRQSQNIDTAQWSRRKPIGRGDRDAIMYLTCPAQTEAGWIFLDTISALAQGDLAISARSRQQCRIPTRRTDVQSELTRQILDETHRLGNWVVNFDDLLDRRQLLNNQIKIIRYKHAAEGGRSLIISSRASDSLLRATLRGRLRALALGYDNDQLDEITQRLITDANTVSGDIVLRAARRGTNASELIGVVLSKFLVEYELGPDRPVAWIFLDDYASWLGQDEKRIADLLCLAPRVGTDGEPWLDIIVTEAKYIGATSANAQAEHSARQLKDTLSRLESALLSTEAPADRDIWLARLSEMLLDGMRDRGDDTIDWRTAIRDGRCRVNLRGYSHVFCHGASDLAAGLPDTLTGVVGTKTGNQERFGPATLGAIVTSYSERRDPTSLRQIEAGNWATAVPTQPAMDQDPERSTDVPAPVPTAMIEPESAVPPAEPVPPSTGSRFRDLLLAWNSDDGNVGDDQAWLDDVTQRCRNALLRYGMSAKLEQSILTPNAALLKFKGTDDLTVSKVEGKATELETTHGIELFSVRAEPGRVTLSIRRPSRRLLSLPEVWKDWRGGGDIANARLLIAVKEDDGLPLFLEPEPAPHTLVAGSTGSGKSVLVQNIILGIAATNRPDQATIILIDPKAGVDYFAFDRLPHLDGPIIDEQDAALERLNGLVDEMQRRYALFKGPRVSNVRAYNEIAGEPLPLIWLIHDEFADWMQIESYRMAVESAVSRLSVKARAAGIYLIFAAQRPDNGVFPMQLRSNLGNRLVLRVDSAGTSDLSLGVKRGGAERLLGKGHLAAILGGGTEPIYAQVPFISEQRLEALVAALIEDLSGAGS